MIIDEVAEIGMATESPGTTLSSSPCPAMNGSTCWYPQRPPAGTERTHRPGRPGARGPHHLPPSFTGRGKIDHAFAARKLTPRIVLEAIDPT